MFRKIILWFCLLAAMASTQAQKNTRAVPVIFDSDMGPDYDDVGAIALLHAFADSGYIKILATVASTKYEGVAAVFNVLNTYFNRPGLMIGVPGGKALELRDRQHWTDTLLAKYPHNITRNGQVPDAVEVYRKLLAMQPDNSVTIITVGFLTNLSALLQSMPDKHSKLDGRALVKQKVRQLVSMAGRFPSGSEFNVNQDPAASQFVFDNWETPVLFSGVEIGFKIPTGLPLIRNESIKQSPVKDAFRICIPLSAQDSAGRMSWDQTAVLIAVKGYKPWYEIEKGMIKVANDGSNSWSQENTTHSYIKEIQSPSVVQQIINTLMMHQPVKH
jgi:pyrimidine-specific ribonucleoside hydrolase